MTVRSINSHTTVRSSEVAQTELNTIRGMANLSRVDEALYQDHETEAERKVEQISLFEDDAAHAFADHCCRFCHT